MAYRNMTVGVVLLLFSGCLVDLPSLEDTSFKCTEDEHCAEGYLCDELNLDEQDRGTCLVVVENPQCDPNVCPADQCVNDPDMGQNGQHRCVERRDEEGDHFGDECDAGTTCPNDGVCVDGYCTELPSCGEGGGCSDGEICVALGNGEYCVPEGGCGVEDVTDSCGGNWGGNAQSGNGICVVLHSADGSDAEGVCAPCPTAS